MEVLGLGRRLDLVNRVGTAGLESAYRLSSWLGPMAIGHTRMSTESRIDLSHSQPFWVHGIPDMATVHNGHVTNYHQLRRYYEQRGVTFYTDNDSEVIGVYLRERMERGRSLPEALADSIRDLDGAFSYLVASPQGLAIVRDRFGFKPMMLVETDAFVAAATEEIALRRRVPGRLPRHRASAGLGALLPPAPRLRDCPGSGRARLLPSLLPRKHRLDRSLALPKAPLPGQTLTTRIRRTNPCPQERS